MTTETTQAGPNSPSWKGGKRKDKRGYIHIYSPEHPRAMKRYVYDHILKAEKAVGKSLPLKAVVHHHNTDQLVICHNQGYHLLLHRRTRSFEACGNAAWRSCKHCGRYDNPGDLYISPNNWDVYHKECQHNYYLNEGRQEMETKEKNIATYESRDGQQITLSFDIIRKYLIQGHPEWVTPQELMYFIGVCKSRALNPFAKDCYLLKFSQNDPAAIITAIDYFRKRAKVQKDCQGWSCGIIVERNGEIVYSNGLMLESDTLLGSWFEAQPKGWEKPFKKEVNLKGYIKTKRDGSITKFWSKDNQPSQITKVVESQGLRTVWPDEFQQLYTPEEIGESDMFTSAEETVSDKINGKGKGKPSTEAKEDIYAAKEPEKKEKKERKRKEKKEDKKEEPKPDLISATYKDLPEPEFTPYVHNNLEAINQLPTKYQFEIHAIWEGFHPDEPFPGSESVEETKDPESPETDNERFYRLVDGAEDNPSGDVLACPETDKGIRILRRKCEKNCNSREGCPSWTEYDAELIRLRAV